MRENNNEFSAIKKLLGKKFNCLFLQPVSDILSDVDMFVINFGKKIEVSLHIFSLLRIKQGRKILLTGTDYLFGKNYETLTNEQMEKEENNIFKNSLLHQNIKNVEKILKNATVVNAYITEVGDVIIEFDNSVTIELLMDAIHDHECYRLIVFDNHSSQHHIVSYHQGDLIYEAMS